MAFTKEVLDEILRDCHGPDGFYGPEGIMKQLTKALAERTMEAELTEQPGHEKHDQAAKPATNRRNGKTGKELRTDHGPMEIAVPRDREGVFGPQTVPKHQKEFRGFDGKILSMYALGLTTRQIQDHLKDIHAVDVSPELISRATDAVKELAAGALDSFAAEWDQKYPMISRSWRNRWNEVIPFFRFSPEIRKAVYTTNAIEPVNFTIQKTIKHRQSFPNDGAAMKLIFMGLKNIARKWTMPIRDWGAALNQFAVIYGEDRVPL